MRGCARAREWRIIPARAGFTPGRPGPLSPGRDHPRSRGVYTATTPGREARRGSSPLARGLPVIHDHRGVDRRDHPRSRGVYTASMRIAARCVGSSPLARGLQRTMAEAIGLGGIIPARAGFTCPSPRECRRRWDHPRSRGVYRYWRRRALRARGSSPLARGLPTRARSPHIDGRIIPARAGFTPLFLLSARPRRDHPRSRGVYSAASPTRRPRAGSSPLARGLREELAAEQGVARIIPARAGFTAFEASADGKGTDHPRSRGVYFPGASITCLMTGSSPLARGLPHVGPLGGHDRRIIPARAGFTASAGRRRRG